MWLAVCGFLLVRATYLDGGTNPPKKNTQPKGEEQAQVADLTIMVEAFRAFATGLVVGDRDLLPPKKVHLIPRQPAGEGSSLWGTVTPDRVDF